MDFAAHGSAVGCGGKSGSYRVATSRSAVNPSRHLTHDNHLVAATQLERSYGPPPKRPSGQFNAGFGSAESFTRSGRNDDPEDVHVSSLAKTIRPIEVRMALITSTCTFLPT